MLADGPTKNVDEGNKLKNAIIEVKYDDYKEILKNKHKLKDDDKLRMIKIQERKTPKEIEAEKKLFREIDEMKRSASSEGKTIFNGKQIDLKAGRLTVANYEIKFFPYKNKD